MPALPELAFDSREKLPHGLTVWSAGDFLLSPDAETAIRHPDSPRPEAAILKKARRRLVLRVNAGADGTVVLKTFPLNTLWSRFHYRKYAFAEAANYLRARSIGLPVPQLFAYFELRPRKLVANTGIVMEDLRDWVSLKELMAHNPASRSQAIMMAIPLLALLYETGANHIDAIPANLLVSQDGPAMRIIDWQYASFVAPRQVAQLALQASRFLTHAGIATHSEEWRDWLTALHAACSCTLPLTQFMDFVAALGRRKQRFDRRLLLKTSPAPPVGVASG